MIKKSQPWWSNISRDPNCATTTWNSTEKKSKKCWWSQDTTLSWMSTKLDWQLPQRTSWQKWSYTPNSQPTNHATPESKNLMSFDHSIPSNKYYAFIICIIFVPSVHVEHPIPVFNLVKSYQISVAKLFQFLLYFLLVLKPLHWGWELIELNKYRDISKHRVDCKWILAYHKLWRKINFATIIKITITIFVVNL